MPLVVRSAVEADEPAIRAIVRAARINPFGLSWRRFVVAMDDGRIVGVGQVKPHGHGSRELASLAVVPDRQGQMIGTRIVQALLAREPGPLYLMCRSTLEEYYQRFGFRTVGWRDLPPYFRRMALLARLFVFLRRDGARILVMRRAPVRP